MSKYPNQEQFDAALIAVIDEENPRASQLLSIPGIYEILSEYYHNEAIERFVMNN